MYNIAFIILLILSILLELCLRSLLAIVKSVKRTPFTSEKESLCSNCNTHRRKQCVLCEVSLPFHSQKCKICSAPQDKSIFEQTRLKDCCSCGASILLSSEVCYSCDSPQKVEDVRSQPPPKPPDTSQPTDQNDSLASNANFDEPAPAGDSY